MNTINILLLIFSWESIYNNPDIPFYADSLFKDRRYYEALTEYKRYAFHNSNSKILDSVYLQIALSYRYTGDINCSDKYLDLSITTSYSQDKVSQIKIEKAINQIIKKEYNPASNLLSDILKTSTHLSVIQQASYYLIIIDVLKSDYTSAKLRFVELKDQLKVNSSDADCENYIEVIALLDSAANISIKDVNKAIMLSSFLPGLGQIYCKACIKEVLNAFLLNGAMVALITISVMNVHYVDAVLFAYLLQLFYVGNRNNTEILCKNFNRNTNEAFRNAILKELAKPHWRYRKL
jgi:beta-N-acetylglucosaminidase